MEFLTLKKANCKNCYKCIRHCPVKAIRFSGNQAHIIGNECILCGQCFVVCPQNAKQIVNETEKAKVFIQSGDPVYVSLAPSFVANYPGVGIESMRKALKKLGFTEVEETAVGATIVKREYDRIMREEERDVVISSCCHSINLLIQKQFPSLLPYLADVVSPMQAHCADIKRREPNAKCVFIGPCVAKKDEADHFGIVDAVLTFEELTNWLKKENLELEQQIIPKEESRARFFPTTGGVLKTMQKDAPQYTYLALDGVENCMAALRDIENGLIHNCFIEMSACVGSCINGPAMEKHEHASFVQDYAAISSYAGTKDFDVLQPDANLLRKRFSWIEKINKQPSENEIMTVLRQMGKYRTSDELNCGSCGYNTCREKAIAVIHGKAEISMCLPYLKDKAESFSDAIVNNNPHGLIVLNEKLEVQQINKAMLNIINIRNENDVLGELVVRVLDPAVFEQVLRTGREVHDQRTFLPQYNRYVEMTVTHDRETRTLIGMLRDITTEEKDREKRETISLKTVEVADKVVEKQMRIVQEIASLLGETAAETKIALTKLKESITNESSSTLR